MRLASSKSKTGYTDELGECELAGVEPGSYEILTKHKSWVSPAPVAVTLPDKGRIEPVIAMEAGGMVSVRVLDHRGKPAAEQGFRIVATDSAEAKSKKSSRPSTGRTDATGRATVGPLAAGSYEAFVQLTGNDAGGLMGMYGGFGFSRQNGPEIGERVSFEVTAAETVEVQLTRPELATVVGTVSDASGPIRNGKTVLGPRNTRRIDRRRENASCQRSRCSLSNSSGDMSLG